MKLDPIQCPKLRVHSAPGVHIPRPGARFSEVCIRSVHVFLNLYILGGCTDKIPGAQFQKCTQ